MQSHLLTLALCTIFTFCLNFPNESKAASYTFTKIVDTKDAFDNISSFSINNNGTVAFWARQNNGVWGVHTGSGGSITTIVDTSGQFSGFQTWPSINDNGIVAFNATLDAGGEGLYISDGTFLTTIADTSGALSLTRSPSINDDGTVAFWASTDSGGSGIYSGNGGSLTTIADTSGLFTGFAAPSINNQGSAAFIAGGSVGGIYVGDGNNITQITNTSGIFSGFSYPSLNDSGSVAFSASLDVGGSGVYSGNGNSTTVIADNSGGYLNFGLASINANGTVVFGANTDTISGIFDGPDASKNKIIGSGDILDGSSIYSVGVLMESLNDSGDVAFTATMADGSHAIYVASVVPLPAAIWLFASGLLGLFGIARRKKAT